MLRENVQIDIQHIFKCGFCSFLAKIALKSVFYVIFVCSCCMAVPELLSELFMIFSELLSELKLFPLRTFIASTFIINAWLLPCKHQKICILLKFLLDWRRLLKISAPVTIFLPSNVGLCQYVQSRCRACPDWLEEEWQPTRRVQHYSITAFKVEVYVAPSYATDNGGKNGGKMAVKWR